MSDTPPDKPPNITKQSSVKQESTKAGIDSPRFGKSPSTSEKAERPLSRRLTKQPSVLNSPTIVVDNPTLFAPGLAVTMEEDGQDSRPKQKPGTLNVRLEDAALGRISNIGKQASYINSKLLAPLSPSGPRKSIINDEHIKTRKQQALNRWDMLRIQVTQGYFKFKQRENVDLSDFAKAVESLWRDVYVYSGINLTPENDSTLDFTNNKVISKSGGQNRRNQRRAGLTTVSLHAAEQKKVEMDQEEKDILERDWGLHGLSFDSIPNCDVNDNLFAVSKGLKKQNQGGWKLLLIGLTQAEPFSRYEAMVDLGRALPNLIDTLNDTTTRAEIGDVLMDAAVSDERLENRIKSIYLLGQFAYVLGSTRECHPMLNKIYKHLARQILQRQYARKNDKTTIVYQDIRLHLFRSIAKFANFKFENSNYVENLIVYMAYEELTLVFKNDFKEIPRSNDLFVVLAILDLLNNNLEQTPANKAYIGAVFQGFVNPLIMVPHTELQKMAIQFISNWLPITNEDAMLVGIDSLVRGLKYSKSLGFNHFQDSIYLKELKNFVEMTHKEECRVSLREKLLRALIQPPGCVARLLPMPGCNGFFCEPNAIMNRTKSILVELPIHAKSNVTLTRPIPAIPGVPTAVTTTPPLYMVGDKWSEQRYPPRSLHEYNERCGLIPTIPCAYTQSPVPTMPKDTSIVQKVEDGLRRFIVPKEPSTWKESDEIPKGFTRIPSKTDDLDGGACPQGFTLICPYPGFDPEKIDRNATYISPIYGKPIGKPSANTKQIIQSERNYYQDYISLGSIDDTPKEHSYPEGTTPNRHTCLYPCKLPGLKPQEQETDFPLGAPVILDIIEPHRPKLRRILTIVESVDEEASNIVVQKGINDVGGLYDGAIFNIYIKGIEEKAVWKAIQLKVINEDYVDGLDFATPNQAQPVESFRESISSRKQSFVGGYAECFSFPVPNNYTATGEPYFTPPVNLPPIPVGYTQSLIPYYGRTPTVKALPAGLTLKGNRYYSVDKKNTQSEFAQKNMMAGYDNDGNPFYVPRGFTLPSPSGFTVDGIPFYDIPSLIRQQGTFALPYLFRDDGREPQETDTWEDLLPILAKQTNTSSLQYRKLESYFLQKLYKNLQEHNSTLRKKVIDSHTRMIGHTSAKYQHEVNFNIEDFSCVDDPANLSDFLREGLAFSHLKPQPIRIVTEPGHCDFHSSRAPMTKTVALRFKAGRGDYTEREYFIAVEPPNVFSIKDFHFKLQGEGVYEIAVTFYPLSMKNTNIDGGLHVFDRYGRKMATSRLSAIKKKFFKITPTFIDAGWVLPMKKKELFIHIENLAEYQITLNVQLGKTMENEEGQKVTIRDRHSYSFQIDYDSIKLKALETLKIPIIFYPKTPGRVSENIIFHGPGGEEILVQLVGTTDMPMAIYPENEKNSLLGITALSFERTQLIKKVDKSHHNDPSTSGLTPFEMQIMKSITAAQIDPVQRKISHTLDFGICTPDNIQETRCLTILNWGHDPITCSLYPYDKLITCPYLVRVAPRSASTINVVFTYNSLKFQTRGNYSSVLEVSCQDFENVGINITAYVGHPIYLPLYDYVFFKPVRLSQSVNFSTVVVNESQYDVKLYFPDFVEEQNKVKQITVAQNFSENNLMEVQAFSIVPVTFKFQPFRTGCYMKEVKMQMTHPNIMLLDATMKGKELYLIGTCIEPRYENPDLKIHPAFEQVLNWFSRTRTLKLEYTDEMWADDGKDVLAIPSDTNYEVAFKTDPYICETVGDFSTTPQSLTIQNRGSSTKKVRFFASSGFTLDPKQKELEPGELQRLDSYFNPPANVGTLVTVIGFAAAVDFGNYLHSSTQIVKRLGLGFMLLPFQNHVEQQFVLDFGKIELSGDCNQDCTRHLMLCNPYNFRYHWSLKVAPSARKTLAFEMPVIRGELNKWETFVVPFRFTTEVSGSFETKCEIFIDPIATHAKSLRLGTIILKGVALYTILNGLPDTIEFGSTIIFHMARKKLFLQNDGSQELDVTVLVRAPFSISTQKFTIPAKSNQIVEVFFNPTEHRKVNGVMQVFANQKLYCVNLTGVGGTAQLVCEEYLDKPIDLGLQLDGNIVWTQIYLKNKGSISLNLKGVTSSSPARIRLEYLGVTSVVSNTETPKMEVKRDYWRAVRRKIKVFKFLLANSKRISSKRIVGPIIKVKPDPNRKRIPVSDILDFDIENSQVSLPELPPLSSFIFRVGYAVNYHEEGVNELSFCYVPICEEVESGHMDNLIEYCTIELNCQPYVPLEITPYNLNFGFLPAEMYSENQFLKNNPEPRYGVSASSQKSEYLSVLTLKAANRSSLPQNLSLTKISPEFTVHLRKWHLPGNSIIEIPVEFHPQREQTQYLGVAEFLHQFGTIEINLTGTGASAELVTDELIDFGNLKLDVVAEKTLHLHNRGILDCSYELDIIQDTHIFSLKNSPDPFDCEGVIASGQTVEKFVLCQSKKKDGKPGEIIIKWKRVPNSKVETIRIPLRFSTGYPEFKMQSGEVDFKTTYIGINKTIEFRITNDGNAPCTWRAECESSVLSLDISAGNIPPKDSIILQIKFSPTDYELLDSAISFWTDAGLMKLVCFGVVGVPYLKVMKEQREVDFGIVTIGQTHHSFIDIANTGIDPIEFEVKWVDMMKDGNPIDMEEFDFFFVEPTHGIIASGEMMAFKLSVLPKDYAMNYQATFSVSTKVGERHLIQVKAVGGQAIVKIKAPVVTTNYARQIATPKSDKKQTKSKKNVPELPANTLETTKNLMKNHIDNLYECLAGLKTAEVEIMQNNNKKLAIETATIPKKDPSFKPRPGKTTQDKSGSASTPSTDSRASSKGFMEELSRMEEELENVITQLDPAYSYETLMKGRGATPSAVRSPDQRLSSLPSSRNSRSFGSYHPGRRVVRKTDSQESGSNSYSLVTTPVSNKLDSLEGNSLDSREALQSQPASGDFKFESRINTAESPQNMKQPSGFNETEKLRDEHQQPEVSSSQAKSDLEPLTDMKDKSRKTQLDDSYTTQKKVGEQKKVEKEKTSQLAKEKNPSASENEGILNSGKEMINLREIQQHRGEFERILETAQKFGVSLEIAEEEPEKIAELQDIISKFMASTKTTIKTVKTKLINDAWIPNRELLQQSLKKLHMSAIAIDSILETIELHNKSVWKFENNVYPLDLICGGERTSSTLLFNLPNEGNIPLEYNIIPIKSDFVVPKNCSDKTTEFFNIENAAGILAPGEAVNISATFTGITSGFYRQGFSVTSNDEEIFSFALTGSIGNPELILSNDSVDFGLVTKGQLATKKIFINNVGSFEGAWDLDIVSKNESDLSSFRIDPQAGKTDPTYKTHITITFNPQREGYYLATLKMAWKDGPTVMSLRGEGGVSKLEFQYHCQEDKDFNGLDFGNCLIGLQYSKKITVKNIGQIEANLDVSHPNKNIIILVERINGAIIIAPGNTLTMEVIYTPEQVEKLRDNLLFTSGLNKAGYQSIAVKGRSILKTWAASGALDFENTPINVEQSRKLIIKNTGTADIPLELKFEPIKLAASFNLSFKNWEIGQPIAPNQEVEITVSICLTKDALVEGKLVVNTELIEKASTEFPFQFRYYSTEMALDNQEAINIGRIAAGESMVATRKITNFSNKKIHYRAKILNSAGNDEILDWKIDEGGESGTLEPNATGIIQAIFQAVKGRGDDLQNAQLIIEKCSDDDQGNWVVFSQLELQGGVGNPLFVIDTPLLDFGLIAIGDSKTLEAKFSNPGTALCVYNITSWDNSDEFTISPLEGVIKAGETISIKVTFTGIISSDYETNVTLQTSVGAATFVAKGISEPVAIYQDGLPASVEFGEMNIAELIEQEVKKYLTQIIIENDCKVGLDLEVSVCETGSTIESQFVKVTQRNIRLEGSESEDNRSHAAIVLNFYVEPKYSTGELLDPEFVHSLPLGNLQEHSLIIQRGSVILATIPVRYTIQILPLSLLYRTVQPSDFRSAPPIEKIDFGLVKFDISPYRDQIDGGSSEDLQINVLGLSEEQIQNIVEKNIVIEGLLIIGESIVIPEEIDFGSIFVQNQATRSFTFMNPGKRVKNWKLAVEENYKDIFRVDLPTEGVAAAGGEYSITLHFVPQNDVHYQAEATFEVDSEKFTIVLLGNAVRPKLDVSSPETDFGVVGVKEPEYKEVTVHNPTELRMRIRPKSNNPNFFATISEFELAPGETKVVKVLYAPKDQMAAETGRITFFQLDEIAEGDDGEMQYKEHEIPMTWQEIRLGTPAERPASNRSEVVALDHIVFAGQGGTFGFHVEGQDIKSLDDDLDISKISSELGGVEVSKIQIKFNKISSKTKVRKMFEIENSGDTYLELGAFNMKGDPLAENFLYLSAEKRISYSVSPCNCKIPPHKKEKIYVVIECIVVQVSATIHTSAEFEAMKTYVRADESLDAKYDLIKQEERYAETDQNLWKVLLPVVRIGLKLPSQEMQWIPPIEPNVARPEIGPFVVRPPAIPEVLQPKNKKWYTNRISMAVEKMKVEQVTEVSRLDIRKEEALNTLSKTNLERNVNLTKKSN
ncbi:hypothetical protein HK103_005651 [Boothiomyces macroporosus]|uniref:Uncharacterized protein n=1 Tax=Boothiomyces macroporosus TaxID=261099 RepID=A0AAD5UHS0_9FUNG|nr:hypothetical protein HK103_005651 [Boothiomyces macroporosus]